METKAKDRSGFTLHTWREKLAWVRKHGIKAYLTWATVDESIGAPLRTSTILNTVIKSEPYRKYNKEKGVAPLDPLYRQGFDAGYMHAMGNVEKHIELRAFQLSSLVERRMEREGTEHVMVVGNTVSPLNCPDDVHVWGAWYQPDERVNHVKRFGEAHRKCVRCNRVERAIDPGITNPYITDEYKQRLSAMRSPEQFKREYEGTFATALPKVIPKMAGHPHTSGKYHPAGKTCNGCGEPILFDDHFQIYEEGIFHKRCAERREEGSSSSVWEEYKEKAFNKLLRESTLGFPKRVVLCTDGNFKSVEHGPHRPLVFPEVAIYCLDAPVGEMFGSQFVNKEESESGRKVSE